MDELKKYWLNLQARERSIISIGATLLILMLLYLYVWEPWHKAIEKYREELPQKRADLQWMKAQGDLASRLKGIKKPDNSASGQPLLTVVERTAQQAGLRTNIKQMTPGDKPGEVKIWLSQISFDKWLLWAEKIKNNEAIEVKSADIQQVDLGTVEVRATLLRL